MKHKIKKEYIKTNLIGFIIAGIIVSGIVVCAAVTFPSNEVLYSNGTSGLKSTDVQGAIDELYETCTRLPGEQIIEDGGLEKDPYECRYFFKGATSNNYITFNNETWRIVSVECDGTIKIIRDANLEDRAWDSSGGTYGRKNWARPADLNTYLNESYLMGTLNSTAQSQIIAKGFSIGSITWGNDDLATQINDENNKKWSGKVALVTVSEYIRTNSNQSDCGTVSTINDNYSGCQNNSWMYVDDEWWTLSSRVDNNNVLLIDLDGSINYGHANITNTAVRPSVYLSSNVQITGGNGSQSNPYTIK